VMRRVYWMGAALLALSAGWAAADWDVGTSVPSGGVFRDVPRTHWAYDAVADLQDARVLVGDADGRFHGDRGLTRYEFAAALQRAITTTSEEAARKMGAGGAKGAQGPAGARGAAGPQGPLGAAGPAGPRGAQGAAGAKGAKGDPGPRGAAGAQGPEGKADAAKVSALILKEAKSRHLVNEDALAAALTKLGDEFHTEIGEIRTRETELADQVGALEARVKALEEKPDTVGAALISHAGFETSTPTFGQLDDGGFDSQLVVLSFAKWINSTTQAAVVLQSNGNSNRTFVQPDEAWVKIEHTQLFGTDTDLTIGRQHVGYGAAFFTDRVSTDAIRIQVRDTSLSELELFVGGGRGFRTHAVIRIGDELTDDGDLYAGLTWIVQDSSGYGPPGRVAVTGRYIWDDDDKKALYAEVLAPADNLVRTAIGWYVMADLVRSSDIDLVGGAASAPYGCNPGADSLTGLTPYVESFGETPAAFAAAAGSAYRPGFWYKRLGFAAVPVPVEPGESAQWLRGVYHDGDRDWRLGLIREGGINSQRYTVVAGTDISVHGDFRLAVDLGYTTYQEGGAVLHRGAVAHTGASWKF
jgi:hypothetical protein